MADESPQLKAPFPAFGGKSRVAGEVWARFGADAGAGGVRNYVEPFAFSAAVLLRRPGGAGPVETINDRNAFVSNFWRAVKADPEQVARHADWPVNEVDLHARHRWLVGSGEAAARLEKVREDPEAFDAKIAGWWCWGACCWIGSGWCDETHRNSASSTRPDLEGQMVTADHLTSAQGVNGGGPVPHLTHGRGVHGEPKERRPGLSQNGGGINVGSAAARSAWIRAWMMALADRLRGVRVCCGHWDRVCDSPSTMTRLGLTGVFLDPPYRITLACGKKNRTRHIYANDKHQDVNALCDEVQAWCLKWGGDPLARIALCGLEGEYPEVEKAGWDVFAWKSNGGYGNQNGTENENAARERIWFSPHCLKPGRDEGMLFGEGS